MNLSMKTVKLQEMVGRAVKGASMNKMLPITELLTIQLKNNVLTLITSDATNYLYICEDKVAGEDFYVVVKADIFAKLVSKMSSENISLELLENSLQVKGNGTYSIELPLDENGQTIVFPDPVSTAKMEHITDINLSTVNLLLTANKVALATTLEEPCYTGYYVRDKVVSTDSYKICSTKIPMLEDAALISPELMELLGIITSEKIEVYRSGKHFVFKTPDCVVYGVELDGIENFSINEISELVDSEFESMCKIPKNVLLGVLDRLSLFVEDYDQGEIIFTFTSNGLLCSSKRSNGSELIPYADSKGYKDFTCNVDIEMMISQVKAQSSDMVSLYYGDDSAIKMVDGNVTQVLALAVDEEEDLE